MNNYTFKYGYRSLLLALLTTLLAGAMCSKKENEISPLEKAQKIWIAKEVRENGTLVYKKESSTNIRDHYRNFQLALEQNNTVKLTEIRSGSQTDVITGSWVLDNQDNPTKLTLKGLSPAPSETNGQIDYQINSLTTSEFQIKRLTVSPKTGNTSNEYILVPRQ